MRVGRFDETGAPPCWWCSEGVYFSPVRQLGGRLIALARRLRRSRRADRNPVVAADAERRVRRLGVWSEPHGSNLLALGNMLHHAPLLDSPYR
jgi:hypothetical protein